ncbi:MAG TPA: beta-galactosidase [Bryobacteraceae bacterium]|nr:beta-galactosidase [Bryobacteraceae bacterium]
MNRRNFLSSALSAPLLAAQAGNDVSERSPQAPASLPRPRWLENGLIDAGGSHEGFLFTVRRGGQRLDARRSYEHEQSEEVIRRLKSQGVEVFHTHLYKGFGMEAEKSEMEDARRAAEIAHRHGLKVDSYIQWNTLMYETFFAEEPRAKEWVQRDISGKPILLVYGYQQSFRYRPCFANQNYLDYLKKIVRYAVEEVKTDFIHFDNFDLNPEPDSCHCPVCVEGFRSYLKEKYSVARRKERFGFENVDYVNPPQWNAQNPPQRMQVIFDPAIQEWVDFRCEIMARALRQMAAFAKGMNPEVAIECNPHGITGGNRAWEAGLDHARFLKSTDVFWTEEENDPALASDGRLISKIRSYKLARAFNNILLAYIAGHPLEAAECLAFDQTLGYAGEDPLRPHILEYIAFYRRNRDLFIKAQDAADVAILRSYPSITYNNARAQLSAILAEQALIQAHIPFSLIFDEHVADLSKHRVLILPDSECLSDAQLASIRQFVDQGGGLVAIGQSGLYDEWRRVRTKPGLADLIDGQKRASGYEERVGRMEISGKSTKKEVGQGRSVYLPGLHFDGALPEMANYFEIDNRFWKRPKNWEDLVAAVNWVAKDSLPLHVEGPEYLVANLTAQPGKRRMMVHLVNYNARKAPLPAPVALSCRTPAPATEVRLYSPDIPEPQAIASRNERSAVAFQVPPVKVYSIAVINW